MLLEASSIALITDAVLLTLDQTDVMKPAQQIEYLEDDYRQDRMRAAVNAAVTGITGRDLDCRVLYLGAGSQSPIERSATAISSAV